MFSDSDNLLREIVLVCQEVVREAVYKIIWSDCSSDVLFNKSFVELIWYCLSVDNALHVDIILCNSKALCSSYSFVEHISSCV